MRILAIETSCDETSVAVVELIENTVNVLAEATSSSLAEHAKIGGIIPEQAARRQVEYIFPVIDEVVSQLGKDSLGELMKEIDYLAVTQGPGLIGSLLVGVETAKTLSYIYDTPLIPVNHLLAHLYACFIDQKNIEFPFVGLIASGGHTDLLLFESHEDYRWLGGTRDDAVGEAMDKIGRLLGLPYPGGPEIDRRSKNVWESDMKFQSPLLHSDDYDFSYSGLKSEVARYIQKISPMSPSNIDEISFAVQKASITPLVEKTMRAASEYKAKSVLIGGGVAANRHLRQEMETQANKLGVTLSIPEMKYTGDNAAMIGAYACFHPNAVDYSRVKADPELYFD